MKRLLAALLVALAISAIFTFSLSRKVAKAAPPRVVNPHYVGAAHPLKAGDTIKKEDLEMVEWPASVPLQGIFTKPEDLVGRSLSYPLDKGQPILDHYLAAAGSGFGLTVKIPDGMRAIALRSDEIVGVAGFVFPGSHVDVLVTYRSDKSPEPTTATVLQDAEVLAVGNQVQPNPDGKPIAVNVVTLLLTPNDAEKAVLASAQGSIHFVLRNGLDRAQVDDPPVALSHLAMDQPTPVAVAKTGKLRPKPYVVETVLGEKATTTSFDRTGN